MKLIIHRPLRSKRISQHFGENKACRYPSGQVVGKLSNGACPTNGGVASVDFYKTFLGMQGHNGIDLPCWEGEMIVHSGMFDGYMKTHVDSAGGIGVDVISHKKFLIDGVETHVKLRFWHLDATIGYDGKEVRYGQMIGLGGNTGASSGAHLHFGLKPCDKDGNPNDRYNGYYGAVDPSPYYNNDICAIDHARFTAGLGVPLSKEERAQRFEHLSFVQAVILELRELLYRL